EDQDGMLGEGRLDLFEGAGLERLGQIDAEDLGSQSCAEGTKLRCLCCHGRSSIYTFQLHQAHTASPMTSGLSRSGNQGSSSVNIVTHCRQEHGILVMSVPQNMRVGPNASKICRKNPCIVGYG